MDKFTIKGIEDTRQGSYNSKKEKVIVVLTGKHKIKRMYIKSIDDYSWKSLTPIFEERISTSAKIFTNKWRGYEPLKKLMPLYKSKAIVERILKTTYYIHQVKSWLRTV